MAWPCISRVCCLARFWNQFDKSDLSVPLTIQNYSDIADPEVRSVTKLVSADRALGTDYSATPDHRGSPTAPESGSRRSCRGRKEPSFKPREDYHPPGAPFQSVSQYTQDFKPWPLPKKENFPWISNGGKRDSVYMPDNSPPVQYPNPGQERGDKHRQPWREEPIETSGTGSNRQEFCPWMGAKPSKSARKKPAYTSPGSHVKKTSTSYRAAFGGDVFNQMETLQVDTNPQQSTSADPAEENQRTRAEASLTVCVLIHF
ncbi:MAP6 protein, partial [Amia calva]|nr:MAP6 protein [Amia calva]